jgi:glycosyltransferase involved in cell wall biosynthesis
LQTTDNIGRREDLLNSLGVPEHSKLVISVGSVRRAKNYVGAIAGVAAARAILADGPPVHYLVCGEQSHDMPAATKAVRQLQAADWVHFLGTRQDITAILAHSDCFLNSSYHESFGLAVLEALCAGLPCVLSNIPANLKFAANMPGCYIADANDASLFGAAIAQCLRMPLRKDHLQRDREPRLAAYSIDACARHYLDYYEQLV